MTQTPSRHTEEDSKPSESEQTCFAWHRWIQMAAQTLIPEDFMQDRGNDIPDSKSSPKVAVNSL